MGWREYESCLLESEKTGRVCLTLHSMSLAGIKPSDERTAIVLDKDRREIARLQVQARQAWVSGSGGPGYWSLGLLADRVGATFPKAFSCTWA